MAILAIDQGTSGTKAIVVDGDDVLAVAEVAVRPDYRNGGVVEQDPEELWRSVLDSGRAAVEESGAEIEAVSLANQGETVLAWDRSTGEPLTPAIVWQDRRAESICAELRDHAELVHERTGLLLDPYFSAPKMTWLRRELTGAGVVTTSDSWLVHRLTGEFVTDTSTASRSLVLDLARGDWDGELLELFGLADEELPRLVASDEIVGTTSAFGGDIPVGGLIVDQQAALLAEGCVEPGSAKCTYGTGAFLLLNRGDDPTPHPGGLATSIAWTLRDATTYCADGQVYTAASAVRWLCDLGLIGSPAELDSVAAEDSGGVLCSPAFAGLAAPWWRADVGASLHGLTLSTGRGEIVRAVLEGIAAHVAEMIDLGERPARLRVDGGLTRSATLMQAQADLSQVPVDLFGSEHATALGAVATARLALDPSTAVEDALVAWSPARTYEPRWTGRDAAAFRDRWRATVESGLSATPGKDVS